MDPQVSEIVVAAIQVVPATVAVTLLAVLLFHQRSAIAQLIGRLASVRLGSLEVSLHSAQLAEARPDKPIPPTSLDSLDRRLVRDHEVLRGARVLWVDDLPANNRIERGFLRSLGVFVQTAVNSTEATQALDRDDFDIVLTDMDRPLEGSAAGAALAKTIATREASPPVIRYIGNVEAARGTPPYFFGLTDPSRHADPPRDRRARTSIGCDRLMFWPF